MRLLVLGNGGRESALVLALLSGGNEVFQWPYNDCLERVKPFGPSDMTRQKLIADAENKGIELVVIGPEKFLVEGYADDLREAGIPVLGPGKEGARLEGSKAFARRLAQRADIPSPGYFTAASIKETEEKLKNFTFPVYVKASGLAAGKGAVFAEDRFSAMKIAGDILEKGVFGAQSEIVVEEFLRGHEISMMALVSGEDYMLLPSAADHKKAYDGGKGPNTGGMGSYAPAKVSSEQYEKWGEIIIGGILKELKKEGIDYRGVIFAGLMVEDDKAKLLEFNCRFGDPETQSVLPLVKNDIASLLFDTACGRRLPGKPGTKDGKCITVIAASKGYPGKYKKGVKFDFIGEENGGIVMPAGMERSGSGFRTTGGRVFGLTMMGDSFEKIRKRIYNQLGKLDKEKFFYRKDIGSI